MNIATAGIENGQIVIKGLSIEAGQEITILQPEESSSFKLSQADEETLLEAIAEAGRGDLIAGTDLLKTL